MLGSKESTNYISNMVAEEEENKQKRQRAERGLDTTYCRLAIQMPMAKEGCR